MNLVVWVQVYAALDCCVAGAGRSSSTRPVATPRHKLSAKVRPTVQRWKGNLAVKSQFEERGGGGRNKDPLRGKEGGGVEVGETLVESH